MPSRRVLMVALAASFVLMPGGPDPASGSTFRRMSDEELVRQSLLVVDVKVVSTVSIWNTDHTQIHTLVDLDILDFVKGDLPAGRRTLRLRILGGVVGDMAMTVIGAPQFRAGERSLLFLRPACERLGFPLVSPVQGREPAVMDGRTGKLMAPLRGVEYSQLLGDLRKTVARVTQPPVPAPNR